MKKIVENETSNSALYALLGFSGGGFIGFLLRPGAPLVGQLPFETVIMRGTNLDGIESLLVSYAETSFNYMLAGAIIGCLFMFAVSKMSSRH
jgi:hypothetical protein